MTQCLRPFATAHVRWLGRILGLILLVFMVFQCSASGFDDACALSQSNSTSRTDSASPTQNASGSDLQQHEITSEFQKSPLPLRILVPDAIQDSEPPRRFPVLYVLPVESVGEIRWGNPVQECLKHDLHNRYQMIVVFPEFSALPWYADHPSDPHLRQESYLLKSVIPFVDERYPTDRSSKGRLVTGFSKSGWGAYSLVLRNPETFSAAAIFDAPLMMSRPGLYGSGPIFGDESNFQHYQLSRLIRNLSNQKSADNSNNNANSRPRPQLAMIGGGNFQSEHEEFASLLKECSIPFTELGNTPREHSWHSGWLLPAVAWLHQVTTQ